MPPATLIAAVAQIAPVFLDRAQTLAKIGSWIERAAAEGCGLVAFGEALVPGYPFWLEHTDAARFESGLQKEIHAHYAEQAVCIEAGHLDELCRIVAARRIAVVLGIIERPPDRGGHSLYCARVHIGDDGRIASVHRKLVPTYEERLSWAAGDGCGLRVHEVGAFRVGSLNCYENWMPLARAALHAQGEDLHVALWPGNRRNTRESSRFLAREGRSFVLAACGLFRREDVPVGHPVEAMLASCPAFPGDGGSEIFAPDGERLAGPVVEREDLLVATLDPRLVWRERQILDQAGHYARPDVLRLTVNRERQSVGDFG